MNERVEELSGLASLYAVSDNPNMLYDVWKKRYTEKLAELVAGAVISKAEDYGLGSDAVEQLKEDFGVGDV